uniref:Uncharacterized protein n=1 Tax=Cannabis sativa TaxID=3483 RepID=A0A803Q7Y7_CANSA
MENMMMKRELDDIDNFYERAEKCIRVDEGSRVLKTDAWVGHPQVPRVQLPAPPTPPASAAVTIVTLRSRNPYPLGVALPLVEGHVANIFGKPHLAGSTKNSQKRYLTNLDGEGEICTLDSHQPNVLEQ